MCWASPACAWLAAARADTVDARCDIDPKGSDKASAVLACSFSQRQGHVRIQRSDGVVHELGPVGDDPARYVDAQGRPVQRQLGLGKTGQIYRLADQSVYVYWDTADLPGAARRRRRPPLSVPCRRRPRRWCRCAAA